MTVGLWNFFPDKIYEPKIEICEDIASFSLFGAEGEANGNILTLSEIAPYGFVAAEIELE